VGDNHRAAFTQHTTPHTPARCWRAHRDAANPQLVHFHVGCSKGTYIRTLGHDLATSLGSTGVREVWLCRRFGR
jgi:tRNA U55 pseudouridine synthase TruB